MEVLPWRPPLDAIQAVLHDFLGNYARSGLQVSSNIIIKHAFLEFLQSVTISKKDRSQMDVENQ